MLIPSFPELYHNAKSSLSRRVNANSQHAETVEVPANKLIKKGEC